MEITRGANPQAANFGQITGTIERWLKDGQPYRLGGPCLIKRDITGQIVYRAWHTGEEYLCMRDERGFIEERYYLADRLHREGGPAVLISDAKGQILLEKWFLYGQLHRLNGPAITEVETNEQGQHVVERSWLVRGKRHNSQSQPLDPQPSFTQTLVIDGEEFVIKEKYYRDDLLHCKVGPAIIKRDLNQRILTTKYYQFGQLHRDKGPAVVKVMGNKMITRWFLNGKECASITKRDQQAYQKKTAEHLVIV